MKIGETLIYNKRNIWMSVYYDKPSTIRLCVFIGGNLCLIKIRKETWLCNPVVESV